MAEKKLNRDLELGKKKFDEPVSLPHANQMSGAKDIVRSWIACIILVLITTFVFSGVLKLQWTNWDDSYFVYNNPTVIAGDYPAICTTSVTSAYQPLVIAMFAWEWEQVSEQPIFEQKAWIFHFNNLWMHLACVVLVFWLMRKLGLNLIWGFFAALLFAIHPMRVESVAWITERKDVMFGMFYLGSLLAYIRYQDTQKNIWIGLAWLLFALSLLSKVQAVTLPITMLAVDWYRGRRWKWGLIFEKVPFFLGSLVIGIVNILFLNEIGAITSDSDGGALVPLIRGGVAYWTYLQKAILPYSLSIAYPDPDPITVLHWLSAIGAVLVVVGAIWLRKRNRALTFGLAFFTINIFFLLHFVRTGHGYTADRYSYIPYIGLVFAIGMLAQRLVENRGQLRIAVIGLMAVVSVIFSWTTIRRIPLWKNSEVLWTTLIDEYPETFSFSYVNRSDYYHTSHLDDKAIADLNTAVAIWPQLSEIRNTRGLRYNDVGKFDLALRDFTTVIEQLRETNDANDNKLALSVVLRNRATILAMQGKFPEALMDLDAGLEIAPIDTLLRYSRATLLFDMQDYPRCVEDLDILLGNAKNLIPIYDARGRCFQMLQQNDLALAEFSKAIALAPKDAILYNNRAQSYAATFNFKAAMTDVLKAQSLGFAVDSAFVAGIQKML